MEDNMNQPILGYTTKEALIKLRDKISDVIKEHSDKNPTG